MERASLQRHPTKKCNFTHWITATINPSSPFMQCYFHYFFVIPKCLFFTVCYYEAVEGLWNYKTFGSFSTSSQSLFILKAHCFSQLPYLCSLNVCFFQFLFLGFLWSCFAAYSNCLNFLQQGEIWPVLTFHPFLFFVSSFYVRLLVTPIGEFSGVYLLKCTLQIQNWSFTEETLLCP